MSRDYELAFILHPEVSEDESKVILTRIEQIVARTDGQIVKVSNWGRRRLAYPIERQRDGIYLFIDMILSTEAVAEINRYLQVTETVIRSMMRVRDAKAVAKERIERAEREERAAQQAREQAARAAAAADAAVAVAEAEVVAAEEASTEAAAEVAETEAVAEEATSESAEA